MRWAAITTRRETMDRALLTALALLAIAALWMLASAHMGADPAASFDFSDFRR
jgi:hypothetical protein